jgi:hypothetical protein
MIRAKYGYKVLVLMTTLLLAPAFAFSLDQADFDKYVSVAVQPYANWLFYSGPYLDYDLKPSVFTTVELSLEYKKYLKLFFDVDINANDNFVGELIDNKAFTRVAGMLGLKNFSVRAAWGKIEGEAVWRGEPVPGQLQSADVSTKYIEVGLLYNWPICSLGLIYQNFHTPVELAYAYDDDVVFDYYGVYFGMSTFNFFMNEFKETGGKFIKPWLDQNLSAGVAAGGISEDAKKRRRFGEIIADDRRMGFSDVISIYDDSPAALSGSWQIIAGLCGGISAGNLALGLGAGYDGFLQVYSNFNYSSLLVRHGATVKVYFSF